MITSSIIPVAQRFNFFPQITKQYLHFEQAIYYFADMFIEGYEGGYWEFSNLSNGGKICYLKTNELLTLSNAMNYQTATMSSEAAGICIMLVALSRYSMISYSQGDGEELERFGLLHSQVEAYARQHYEWSLIQRIID